MSTDAQFDPPRPWPGGPQKQHPMGEREAPSDEPTAAERAQEADHRDGEPNDGATEPTPEQHRQD